MGEVVDDSIQKCPVEYRTRLYNNIVLSGGSTLFDGFDKRLQKQVQGIVDNRLKGYEAISGNRTHIDCKVAQNLVQKYAVWFGGSVLGANPNFHKIAHSRENYQEYGPSICRQNSIFQE